MERYTVNKKIALSLGILVVAGFVLLTGCDKVPTIPSLPALPSDQTITVGDPEDPDTASDSDYLDDLGCFPVGCDLPPGMKELCQAYELGNISWPGNCTDMPGEACQTLCEREKASAPTALPMTTIDAYQVGWMEPVQIDDNIDDALRPEHGWTLPMAIVGSQDRVLLLYGVDLVSDQYSGTYYRYWDGEDFSEPALWNEHQGPHVVDSMNRLHIIDNENYFEENAALVHVIWDGTNFTKTTLFPGRFVQPFVLFHNLDIDEEDNLHLTFQEKSNGVLEIWYTRYDGQSWSEPLNLSQSSTNSISPSLAVGKDGMVYLAWHEEIEDASIVGQTAPIKFTFYDGHSWSEPILSTMTGTFVEVEADKRGYAYIHAENQFVIWDGTGWDGPYEVEYPGWATAMYHRATEDNGQLHFIWNRYHEVVDETTGEVSYQREVCYRKRTPDGTWSPVISLGVWSAAPTYAEIHSLLEVDSQGVVHTAFGGNVDGVLKEYYTNSGETVLAPELLEQEVYQSQLIRGNQQVHASTSFPTQSNTEWAVQKVSQLEEKDPLPRVDLDSSGTLHAVWQHWGGEDFEIFYNSYDGTNWGSAENISQFEGYDTHPVVAVDSLDRVHVAWIRWERGTSSVYWTFLDDGNWSGLQRISERVPWKTPLKSVAMVEVTADVENAIRPSIASGPDGTLAMSWTHNPEAFVPAVATARYDGVRWIGEVFPGDEDSWALAADWSTVDLDIEGGLHLTFISSGMMDEDSFLFAQPFHMIEENLVWSEPNPLLPIPADSNPTTQLVFHPIIQAMGTDRIFVAFSMRPFERENIPYRLDTENSNAYLVFWDGRGWSEPRRLDPGDAFGPSYVDIALDNQGIAHLAWVKYDSYNKHYSLYYATSDGYEEGEIVLLWQADFEQEPYPILKPDIAVGEEGSVHVLLAVEGEGVWKAFHFSRP